MQLEGKICSASQVPGTPLAALTPGRRLARMLDLFFKKYAWTAHLVLLFVAAWLLARTVNTVVGAALRPRPRVDLVTRAGVQPPTARPQLDAMRLYPLFGVKPPAPEVVEAAAPGKSSGPTTTNCHDRAATPVKSALRAQLVGGLLAEDPRASLASITDLNTRETRVYGVGDAVLGASILSVERLRDPNDESGFKVAVVVCNNGVKESIDFGASGSAPVGGAPAMAAAPPPPAAGGPPPPGSAAEGVSQVADNRYEVKKKYLDDTLSNLSMVATQARIVPSFKNGVANGFKLFGIQPNSLYSAIGMENGDVIQRINGYEINSPDKALEVYQKLRESSHISVEVERNGQTVRKEYNVTGS